MGERAEQQTTLKVVCGLSRTRALCRSESPRECAPRRRACCSSPPLPPSPSVHHLLLPLSSAHTVAPLPPLHFHAAHFPLLSRTRSPPSRCPPRPAVLLEARRGGPLDSPVNPPPPPLPPPPRRDHVSSTSLEFTGILGLSIRHPEFQILRSHASISSFFSRSRVSRSGCTELTRSY